MARLRSGSEGMAVEEVGADYGLLRQLWLRSATWADYLRNLLINRCSLSPCCHKLKLKAAVHSAAALYSEAGV